MFYKVLISVCLLSFLSTSMIRAQVAEYNMDDCALSDSQGNLDGIVFGPSCACGVRSNGLLFSSGNQFAELDRRLNTTLAGDWTISLYVQVDPSASEALDILYLGDQCRLDSLLSLRYLPDSRIFRFILSDSPNNDVRLDAFADDNSCWQYLAITGVLASADMATSSLALNVDAALAISNSPCQSELVNPDAPFIGSVDELRIYDRVLTEREIRTDDYRPDQIITNDTTIFIGASLRLSTGGTCSDDFSWAPTTFLDDPNDQHTYGGYHLYIDDQWRRLYRYRSGDRKGRRREPTHL